MSSKQYTAEQMRQARRMPLSDFILRYDPDSYAKEGNSYRPKFNHSISIEEGFPGYNDFETGKGGNPVDYLVNVLGFKTNDAVFALIGDNGIANSLPTPAENQSADSKPYSTSQTGEPKFPDPDSGKWSQLFAYLINTRGISAGTIRVLIKLGLIYQSSYHGNRNIIFMNRTRDWGEIRGTNTFADARCKNRRSCPNYEKCGHQWCSRQDTCADYVHDPCHYMVANSREGGFWAFNTAPDPKTAYVCEGAIDAISLCELLKIQQGHFVQAAYIGIGGAGKKKAIDRICKEYPDVILAVDNDDAGAGCRANYPNLSSIVPTHKDWNEDLLSIKTNENVKP